jgi:hypothetical protein
MGYYEKVTEYMKEAYDAGYRYGVCKRVIVKHLGVPPEEMEHFNKAIRKLKKENIIKVSEVDGENTPGYYEYIPQ